MCLVHKYCVNAKGKFRTIKAEKDKIMKHGQRN